MPEAGVRPLGVHVSISGGIHRAVDRADELGCTAMQIFSHNPRGWSVKPLSKEDSALFRAQREKRGIFAVIHSSYLINLAAKSNELLDKSIRMMKIEMDRADDLGIEHVILHTGSASGVDADISRRRAVGALGMLSRLGKWRARILLENTAGEKGDVTSSMEELGFMLSEADRELVDGICLDSCHAFAAGYDLRDREGMGALIMAIEKNMGIDRVKVLHLNDSKRGPGSGVDRHEHIGEGEIGNKGLSLFLNHPSLRDLPVILETPKKSEEDDRRNLARARELAP